MDLAAIGTERLWEVHAEGERMEVLHYLVKGTELNGNFSSSPN